MTNEQLMKNAVARKFASWNPTTPKQAGEKILDTAKYLLGGGAYGRNMNEKYKQMKNESETRKRINKRLLGQ